MRSRSNQLTRSGALLLGSAAVVMMSALTKPVLAVEAAERDTQPLPTEMSQGAIPTSSSLPSETLAPSVPLDQSSSPTATVDSPPAANPEPVPASPSVEVQTPPSPPDLPQPAREAGAAPTEQPTSTPAIPTSTPATRTAESSAEFAILSPAPGVVLDRPATSVVIQYPTNHEVDLFLNGQPVDRGLIGRKEVNNKTGRITEAWYGISLDEGDNTFVIYRKGEKIALATTKIEVSGAPTGLNIRTVESRIPADGRSIANIEGDIVDRRGNRSNWNAMITLEASAGEFVGLDAQPDVPGFQVDAKNGAFSAQLRAGLNTEFVRIRAATNNLEAFTQLQLTTLLRPTPLITGVVDFRLGARGTNFYDRFREFLPLKRGDDTVFTAKGAAFGTASVGEWLITGAYNSDRPLNEDATGNSRLFGDTQASEQLYGTYGDTSSATRVAPSQDSLFLRIERTSHVKDAGTDYFMWGDFNTTEFATTAQKFTAIGRALHGFKANFNIGPLQLSALYSNTVQGFQRDSIVPDGTSGYYFLSRRPVIDGSEVIFIELEELNRPGTVVEVRPQVRGQDYTIDYDRGSLLFREPILRTEAAADGTILVRKIVATYQYDSPGSDTSIYAGRARYHFSRTPGKESWLGATYWREIQGSRNFELYGADTQISIGPNAKIVAEYAHSSNNAENLANAVTGSAYRIEATGKFFNDKLDIRAYYSKAETGFANSATISFIPGQTRYGVEATGSIGEKTRLNLYYDHEDNVGIAPQPLSSLDTLLNPGAFPTPGEKQDNSLTTISAGIEHTFGKATLGLSYIHRDRIDRAQEVVTKSISDQLEVTFSYALRDNLRLNALATLNLRGDDPIYTNHAQVGATWDINPNISVSLNQHYFWGGQYGDRAITSLDTNAHYNIGKNTQLTGRFSLFGSPNGLNGQGAAGIKHSWIIRPGLTLDVAYEYVMGQFFGRTGAGNQFEQPYAVGDGASALGLDSGHNFSVSLAYTANPDLQAGFSYQFRTSSGGRNSVLLADVAGKITPSLSGLIHYEQGGAANQLLGVLGDTIDLKVGLAYRNPTNDRFNALLAYEFRRNPATTPNTILLGSGTGSTDHTLSLEGIYAPNWQWELYGKVGYRQSTSFLADDYVSRSSLLLGQLRATYRFNYRWDVTAEGRIIQNLSGGGSEFGATAEVGYYLTPNLRLAAGYAFGSVNNQGFDNVRSNSGPYLGLTVKLDELFKGFKFYKKIAPPKEIPATPISVETPASTADSATVTSPAPTASSKDTENAADLAPTESVDLNATPLTESISPASDTSSSLVDSPKN